MSAHSLSAPQRALGFMFTHTHLNTLGQTGVGGETLVTFTRNFIFLTFKFNFYIYAFLAMFITHVKAMKAKLKYPLF